MLKQCIPIYEKSLNTLVGLLLVNRIAAQTEIFPRWAAPHSDMGLWTRQMGSNHCTHKGQFHLAVWCTTEQASVQEFPEVRFKHEEFGLVHSVLIWLLTRCGDPGVIKAKILSYQVV